MLTFKEYKKERFEKAKLNDWFDENGNSSNATAYRGFFNEMRLDTKRLALCFLDVEIKELIAHIAKVAILLLSPVLFIPLLISRAYFSRKRANKEMMKHYINDVINKETK